MIYADHLQLHYQENSKCCLPKLESKIEPSCSNCLDFPEPFFLVSYVLKRGATDFSAPYLLITWLSPCWHQEHEHCMSSEHLRSTVL